MKCSLTRFRIGRALDDGRALPPSLNAHLTDCPGCAAWLRVQENLTARLRMPVSAAAEAPPFLQAKVQRAIRTAPARASLSSHAWMWRGASVAAGLAVVGAIAGAFWDRPSSSAPAPPAVVQKVSPPPEAGGGLLLTAAARLDQPLRREWSLLNADALAAVNALKSGFLPNELLPD